MEIKELLAICKQAKNVVCYGAGVRAKDLTVFLKWNKIEIAAYCVSSPKSDIETIDNRPLIAVKDIKKYSKTLIVVSVSPNYHNEIRELLTNENVKNVVFIDDYTNKLIYRENVKSGWRARGWILYNGSLKNKLSDQVRRRYDRKIKKIRKTFSIIEIRFVEAYNIAGLAEAFCKYSDMCKDDDVYILLFPQCSLLDGRMYERKFIHPNQFIIESFKGTWYETLNNNNIDFWKYFLSKYPSMFIDKLDYNFRRDFKEKQLIKIKNGDIGIYGKCYINFSDKEKAAGKNILNRWHVSSPYICINSRDAAYSRDVMNKKDLWIEWMNEFRNSNISDFELLCNEFQDLGIKSVRIGYDVDSYADYSGCIDYANKFRSPFMDAYINDNCEFEIGDASGVQSFPALFNKPIVMLNCPQVGMHFLDPNPPLFFERDLLIMKKLWDQKRNKYLSLKEIMKFERLSTQEDKYDMSILWKLYHEYGIVPVKNTPEEILDVALEMYGRIKGTYKYDSLDEELQRRYVEIAKKANDDDNWFWLPIRMGAKFLRQNQWLLE
ncbi:TIGR04372 family glycosyltransferase [Selenomonas ruminantium]|uniref:TIGR04372 family glycosyltransferase n=1 Tax=Selenomonas ruminantium TaxID=971 RepID=UPI000404106A|nr:TIGR04372 family glycosyltransferase [Selenomonas ruminantium]